VDASVPGHWKTDKYFLTRQAAGSVLAIPLVLKGTVVGVLFVEKSAAFSSSSVEILSVLAAPLIAIVLENAMILENLTRQNQELLSKDKLQSELMDSNKLLHQLLPTEPIEKLKRGVNFIAEEFKDVTILYTELVDFTRMCSKMSPTQLMVLINDMYSAFDRLIEKHNLYKVEIIGDAYNVVAGAFTPGVDDQYRSIAQLALDLVQEVRRFRTPTGEEIQMRLGIHTGPAYGGVVGRTMPRYCFFGHTVAFAAKMESTSRPMMCQVSEAFFKKFQPSGLFEFEQRRDRVHVRKSERVTTYFLIKRTDHAPVNPKRDKRSRSNVQAIFINK